DDRDRWIRLRQQIRQDNLINARTLTRARCPNSLSAPAIRVVEIHGREMFGELLLASRELREEPAALASIRNHRQPARVQRREAVVEIQAIPLSRGGFPMGHGQSPERLYRYEPGVPE